MVARAWDRAVGTGDSDAAHAFMHAFSRAFGGDSNEPASCEASANDPAMTALKTRVLTELMALDAGSVPSAGYTQQHACALSAGILDKPGEVSDAAHDAVDFAVRKQVVGRVRHLAAQHEHGNPEALADAAREAEVLGQARARRVHADKVGLGRHDRRVRRFDIRAFGVAVKDLDVKAALQQQTGHVGQLDRRVKQLRVHRHAKTAHQTATDAVLGRTGRVDEDDLQWMLRRERRAL